MNNHINILLIEDDQAGRQAIRDVLELEMSCQIAEAEDSLVGESLLNQQVFDCILLDYQLPYQNGLDFLTKIRDAGVQTPVIMLTNLSDMEIAVELMKAGASDFIPKSAISAKKLANSIQQSITAHQKLRQSSATLRQYLADLEARNGNIEVFTGTVAHDLKNIFSPIIGMAQLLQADYEDQLDSHAHFILGNIVKGASQGFYLLDALLFLAWLQHEKPEAIPLDMGKVVGETLTCLAADIEEAGAEIIAPTGWLPAMGDEMWVAEVWFNFFSFILKNEASPLVIEIGSVKQEDGMVQFWLRDNGASLTPSQQKELFTPFNKPRHEHDARQGLGMAINRKIIEALGGEVEIESRMGVGNTFWFTLPAFEMNRN